MSVRFWSIEGNSQKLDGGSMFGNAPRAVWEKWLPPDELGRVALSCRALLAEIDGKKILCETGIGCFFEPKLAERFGVQNPERHQLLENLKSAGITPDEIDFVILSHLHFDHAGGLLPLFQEGQKPNETVFPNAEFIVGNEAWHRAQNPHSRDRASFIPGLTEILQNSGRLKIVDGTSLPGFFENQIEFFISDGHTPGQMLTIFKTDSQRVVFCGDLIPGQPWVHVPITMGYDRFPELLIDEKEKLYSHLDLEKDWLFFTHDPQFSSCQIQKNEKGRFSPVHSQETLFNWSPS